MKNIYKDEVIGNIDSNLIYDNEIKGIFGEISNPLKTAVNKIGSEIVADKSYTITFGTPVISGGSGDQFFGKRMPTQENFYANFDVDFNFTIPIENVTINNNETKLYVDHIYNVYSILTGNISEIPTQGFEAVINKYKESQHEFNFNQYFETPITTDRFGQPTRIIMNRTQEYTYDRTYTANGSYLNVSIIESSQFHIKINVAINWVRIPTSTQDYIGYSYYFAPAPTFLWEGSMYCGTFVPRYIEIVLNGITYEIALRNIFYGSQTNALELKQSTLLTTKSTYQNRPLWEHLGSRIVNKWYNGKQVVTLPIVVNDEADMKEVNDEVYVFNVRRGEIDESNQIQVNNASIFKTVDGTAKKFIIVNITNNYDGSFYQSLDLQEITK